MKNKIATIVVLLLSLMSFGQDREYKITMDSFRNKNYYEVIIIGEKILKNQYGSITPKMKSMITGLMATSYELLDNYSEAITKYNECLELIKDENDISPELKSKSIIQIKQTIEELKSKLQKSNITESKPQPNETSVESSSNKTTTLVVTGQGKTKYEAQQNALRNAIEQAFGAFISSKTEVLNDNLVKDEIVSVSNGNIQKFEEVSEVLLQNNDFSVTLKATVSITKLTSFVESKGWEVEFKGALFGANIRQQKLNEEAEFKAILNLCEVSNEMLSNSLDYSLETKEPVISDEPNKYQIAITVKTTTNENFKKFTDYFRSVIKSICMTTEEAGNYKSLNKNIYVLLMDGDELPFRNSKTCIALQNLFIKSNQYLHNFIVATNIAPIPLHYKKVDFNITWGHEMIKNRWRLNVIIDKNFDDNFMKMSDRNYTGYPQFYAGSEYNGYRSRLASWNIYFEYLIDLRDSNRLFDKNIYYSGSAKDYGFERSVQNGAGFPDESNYIGQLDLYPLTFYSKYVAKFSEEDIMKITGFTVKKLN